MRGAGIVPRSLTLEGLAGYTTTVQFPERGLVLATGKNGVGKSLLFIDAIGWALWGESPRGKNPEGVVKLETVSGLSCQRKRVKSGASSLTFSATQYETTSKAQETLEAIVGDYESWYHASVFTSQEAGVFSRVPDKARKALIEQAIPDFDRFDEALKRCRADLAVAARAKAEVDGRAATSRSDLALANQRIADIDIELKEIESLAPPAGSAERLAELLVSRKRKRAHIEKLQSELAVMREPEMAKEHHDKIVELEGDLKVERRRFSLTESGKCPTCEQSVDGCREDWKDTIAQITARLSAVREIAERDLTQRRRVYASQLGARRCYLEELRSTDCAEASEEEELRRVIAEQGAVTAARDRLQKRRQMAEALARTVEGGLRGLLDEVTEHRRRVAELTAAEQVLAPKGVRAALLRRTTDALHELTNLYLARFWPGVGVALTIDEEKQTVTLLMSGHPRHTDPAKLSNGELRRIDCALFFARRDLLMAAYSVPTSMVVLDEALDGLDPEGVEAVGGFLAELAETQPVVVISHADGVWSGLPWTKRWEVRDGQVA